MFYSQKTTQVYANERVKMQGLSHNWSYNQLHLQIPLKSILQMQAIGITYLVIISWSRAFHGRINPNNSHYIILQYSFVTWYMQPWQLNMQNSTNSNHNGHKIKSINSINSYLVIVLQLCLYSLICHKMFM